MPATASVPTPRPVSGERTPAGRHWTHDSLPSRLNHEWTRGNRQQLRASWDELNLTRQAAIVRAVLDHAVIAPGFLGARILDPDRRYGGSDGVVDDEPRRVLPARAGGAGQQHPDPLDDQHIGHVQRHALAWTAGRTGKGAGSMGKPAASAKQHPGKNSARVRGPSSRA